MAVWDWFTASEAQRRAATAEVALRQEQDTNLHLLEQMAEQVRESSYLAQAELALDDEGWTALRLQSRNEFTRPGLERAAQLSRIMAIANPLVRRGIAIRIGYIWAGGVTIGGRATGEDGTQDVNQIVQAFLDDAETRRHLTGQAARQDNERSLGTDGNLFFALWTSPATGRVRVRVVPFEEVVDIVTDPQDRGTPWYYIRRWTQVGTDGKQSPHVRAHPAADYAPVFRPSTIEQPDGTVEVSWDAPILHVAVNGLQGWKWGIGDAYAAIPWGRGYSIFLDDWRKLVKAVSRYAYELKVPASKAARARTGLERKPARDRATGETNDVGSTAVTSPDVKLEAVSKTGATIDSDSGRPLAAMVAAALDVPVTMLLGDPGQTGARAVAETLDEPTRNAMGLRRELWSDVYRDLLGYVVLQAVKARRLRGMVTRDFDREVVTLAADTEATIEVTWPAFDDVPVDVMMKAIQAADQIGKTPELVIARLVLDVLDVRDPDEVLESMVDEQGRWIGPGMNAGQAAVDAFNAGRDPADALA